MEVSTPESHDSSPWPTSPSSSTRPDNERKMSLMSFQTYDSERRDSTMTAPSSIYPEELEDEKGDHEREPRGERLEEQIEEEDTMIAAMSIEVENQETERHNDGFRKQPDENSHPVEYPEPYTHPTMPWDRFYSSRPSYPASMFDSWLDYHQGPLTIIHDLGAGSGLGTDGLLTAARRRLQHLDDPDQDHEMPHAILSDPGRENLEIASRFMAARHPDTRVDCWLAPGEVQDQYITPASLDMVICTESLHWMDIPVAVSQAAASLRDGGTFAVVLYSCFPRIQNNARVKTLLRWFVEDHLQRNLRLAADVGPTDPKGVEMHENWKRGLRYLAYGLDCVELPAEEWEGIKRYEINCGSTGWWWPRASKDYLGCAPSRSDASAHVRLVYEDHENWARQGNLAELKELLMSIQVGFCEQDWERPQWKELESLVRGPLQFVWQVHMLVARKKSQEMEEC